MSIQPLISIEKVIFKILILSFITSSCINKKEVSGNLCTLNLVSENLNKLSVVLSFDNIQILPHPGYAPNLKGKIKHIEEIEYRSVIRYDETIVTPLDTISYVFDKYGNLTEINQKHNITAFQYENNLMTSISDNGDIFNFTRKLRYSKSGLLLEEIYLDELGENTNISIEYNLAKLIFQEKLFNLKGGKKIDSVARKFAYDERGRLSDIILYNETGQRNKYIRINYDEVSDKIVINVYYVWLRSDNENPARQIILYFNEACRLKELTQVTTTQRLSNLKTFNKITLNTFGDVESYITYQMVTLNDSLKFNEISSKEQGSEVKIGENYNYTYVYDQIGNWIEKHENNFITKRKIQYL